MYSKQAGNGRPSCLRRWSQNSGTSWFLTGFLMLAVMVAFIGNVAQAQSTTAIPVAGTSIGNQAAATYTDATGQEREVVSNTVQTIVQHVPSHTLEQDRNVIGAPNQTVYFSHTVTNTGNGPDTYDLAAAAGTGSFTPDQIAIFADVNGDGEPDDSIVITGTPVLAPGESFNFVVQALVPATVAAGVTGTVTVTATAGVGTLVQTNTDTITVSHNAVVVVSKAISQHTIAPNAAGVFADVVTYTLTIQNKGQVDATNIDIADILNPDLNYVAGSGRWNGQPTALTDTPGVQVIQGDSVNYSYDGTDTISVTLNNLPVNSTKTVSFNVQVATGTQPGTIPNTASFGYNDGVSTISHTNTNTVNLKVTGVAGVVPDPSDGRTVTNVPSAPQNSTVVFTNVFTNTGTGPDTFDITFDSPNTFPAGTTFGLFKADGGTPLVDTNGNNIPDTGSVAAGANFVVVVKAYLPANASGSGPYAVTKRATSTVDSTKSATITDTLGEIVVSTVTLDNDPGAWDGISGPVTTLSGNPGETVVFTLGVVNNHTTGSDNYDLFAGSDAALAAFTNPAFTVVFRNAAGAVITNTGNIPAGGRVLVTAEVTIPEDQAPVTASPIYFQVVSRATGATATKLDAVTVNTIRELKIDPDNTGQTTANNSITYLHRIQNNGNVAENFLLTDVHSDTRFYANFYEDGRNGAGDGVLPANQAPLDKSAPIALAPGEYIDIFVRVFAPADAVAGQVDVATLTVSSTIGGVEITDSATDTTTIVSGQLVIRKEQALDPGANGVIVGSYGAGNIAADPGQGIRYRITVTNNGSAPVHNVVVSDSTPLYTFANNGNGTVSAAGSATYQVFTNGVAGGFLSTADSVVIDGVSRAAVAEPGSGSSGSYQFNIGTLQPSQTAIVYFGVTINN